MNLLTDEVEDPEEWWEEALLRHPLFQKRIAQARQSGREGKGVSIEQLRVELDMDAPDVTPRTENGDGTTVLRSTYVSSI